MTRFPRIAGFFILCHGLWGMALLFPQPRYVPGEVIIKVRSGVRAQVQTMLARNGRIPRKSVEELGLMLVSFPDAVPAEEMARRLATDPNIEFAHPNYIGQGGFTPDDTHFGTQWHHENTGQTGGTTGADIQSVPAWDITRGDPSIVVAVLDTGIDSDHPDFVGRLLAGFDFVNTDNDPEADHPHGAQVTGLMGANGDNAFGVAGVDHFASILPVKVLDQNNAGTTMDLIEGLNFAAAQGADIISMSLINYPNSMGLQTALQAARNAGSILIACAGNGGIGNADVSFPGASPLTISIGATDHDDVRAGFSGTGAALDLVAPGSGVRTVLFDSAVDTFSNFSGCSAATPVAAGVASLVLSVDNTLTHDQMRQILIDGAEDQLGDANDTPGRDDFYGFGRINALLSLCQLDEMDPVVSCPSDVTVECSAVGGTPSDDSQLTGFLDGGSATDDLDTDPDVSVQPPLLFPVGATTDVTFEAVDVCGNGASCTASVTVEDTTAPSISCPDDVTVECASPAGFSRNDPQLAAFFAGVSASDLCDGGIDLTDDAPAFFPLGETDVTFMASDDAGNVASCIATVTVADTTPPVIQANVSPDRLWPPNHELVPISAFVEISDVCDPGSSFVLSSITSNEPDNGKGDGNSSGDIQAAALGTADVNFYLRAERSGRGSGRLYTIVYTATDESGNSSESTVFVTVPHNR